MPFFCNPNFAARRGGAPIQFFQNWENDVIFCNPTSISKKLGMQKNDIVFAYKFCNSPRPSIRRIEGDKCVSENDIIFCNFNFKEIGIAKNDIVFPILKELNWRPAAASGKFAPASEQQLFIFVDV